MSNDDGRRGIGHRATCKSPEIAVERARVRCLDCGRFAPRTDVAPGECTDCGGPCRPDMRMCAKCRKASNLRAKAETIIPTATTPATPAMPTWRLGMVCRGCHKPVTVKVKPGKGFVCSTCTGGAKR